MTQAIYCCHREGLVLASDSLTLLELGAGQVRRLSARKLFALPPRAAVLAAGAPVGAELAARLAEWLQARQPEGLGDLLALSRDYLAEGYARYLRGARRSGLPSLHFIIAGHTGGVASPYEAVLLQSEAGELPFKELCLGRVFTLPRRVAQEGQIARQIVGGASLRGLAESCLTDLELIAARNPGSVAGPFHVAMVSEGGVRFLEA